MKTNMVEQILFGDKFQHELDVLVDFSDKASHSINSVIHLIDEIYNKFDEETATDLHKRLLLSIKNRDYSRFERGLENAARKRGGGE